MSPAARLTIAIPTFNRAFYVTTAIDSLREQANASERWRVVVVDNNSTDDTAERLALLAAQWPRLTVLFEPEPGASVARNRALAWSAQHGAGQDGEGYILYVDDECKFQPDYVDRALAIIDRHKPRMFGGPIHPWYVVPPPAWFRPEYGSYSLPWATGLSDRISLSAGNMGFSIAALAAIGGFDPARGPRGTRLAFGEETAVENRMLAMFGADAVWFDPDLVNFHAVRPEKFRWRQMLREHFLRGMARGELQAAGLVSPPGDPVPETLRPRPRPNAGTSGIRADLPGETVRLCLGAVRRAGLAWFKLTRASRQAD